MHRSHIYSLAAQRQRKLAEQEHVFLPKNMNFPTLLSLLIPLYLLFQTA